MSLRTALDREMTEAEFQTLVINYARLRGWVCHHTRPGRTAAGWRTPLSGDPGFVDLVLVRDRVLFVELKTEAGRLSPFQQDWRSWLIAAGADYRLWRPSDWFEVEETLR